MLASSPSTGFAKCLKVPADPPNTGVPMLVMPDGAQTAQRIIVVEDDEDAALLGRILGAAGYEEVRTASSAL